ncbi:uncharacterized protein [Macrobrachium rosenbergii]|uniref:uncharacterized protein n=1 Tax=Macrobrachium rosenbergii TaxID=79674 RepID=UPI0034D42243
MLYGLSTRLVNSSVRTMERKKKTASFAGFLLLSGLFALGNYGICSASETEEVGDPTRERTENEKLTEESLLYDLVPSGGEADNITRLQVDSLREALGLQGGEDEVEFSLCVWFELRLKTTAATLFSYATSDCVTNALLLYVSEFELGYVSEITRSDFSIFHAFEPLRWYHTCLVVRKLSGDKDARTSGSGSKTYAFIVYVDGSQKIEDLSATPLPLDGTLVIGQDQDGLGTAFAKEQSLVGRVSLSLFKEDIGNSGAEALFNCQVVENQVPVAWDIHGWVSNASFNACELNGYRGIVIPFKTDDKEQAERLCQMINTSLALPTSEEENEVFAELLSREPTCNSLPYFTFNIGWLGVFKEENSSALVQEDSLRAFNKMPYNMSDLRSNDFYMTSEGSWRIGWPNIACPLCFGKLSARFYLFGLDKINSDRRPVIFYPRASEAGSFILYSLQGITIEKEDKWKIVDRNRNTTLASTEEPFFLGRKPWIVLNASDPFQVKSPFFPAFSFSPSSSVRMLTLSTCFLDEFTCNNGDCVPMTSRCDFRRDCLLGEDEDSCSILNPLRDYERGTPPPQRPFNLSIVVRLTKVASINILTETLQVNMKFRIKWDDSRLTFNNLMGNDNINYLGQHMNTLWLPKIMVLNEEPLAGTADPIQKLYVARAGDRPGSIKFCTNYIYKGSENPLVLRQLQSFYISCGFDMRAFPFDVQDCWINGTIQNTAQDSMVLSAHLRSVDKYLNLNEYDVLACNLTVINNRIIIRVTLRRYPEYHILSSYFPVFLLHLLGYGTLFIDPQDFQDRGTMSLTSLLVLISFYSDTAMSLPKTAYLKLLDIWYIFSVTFLSLIIGVHLATNKVSSQKDLPAKNSQVKKVLPMPKGSSEFLLSGGYKPKGSSSEGKGKPQRSYNACVLFVAKIFFGLVYVIFHILYWGKVVDSSLFIQQ